MAGSSLSGSARYFRIDTPAENRALTMMPPRTRASIWSLRVIRDTLHAPRTASSPKMKATPWSPADPSPSTIASAAPNPAPLDAPSTSGETSGFRNRLW